MVRSKLAENEMLAEYLLLNLDIYYHKVNILLYLSMRMINLHDRYDFCCLFSYSTIMTVMGSGIIRFPVFVLTGGPVMTFFHKKLRPTDWNHGVSIFVVGGILSHGPFLRKCRLKLPTAEPPVRWDRPSGPQRRFVPVAIKKNKRLLANILRK